MLSSNIWLFKYLKIYPGDINISKTEKLVRECLEDFGSSPLWSVRLKSGLHGCMFGAKLVQSAPGDWLQIFVVQ